ncbi:MAG: ATP-binding cassette domain-containing protein [Pseudomonadota bacterium]
MPEGVVFPPVAGSPVRLAGVSVARSREALLTDLSITLRPGGVTAVMGPNGAGKSVLLRVVAGLIAPDAGEVAVSGPVALVPQTPVLLRRSLRGNLAHALWIYGIPRAERPARIAELLDLAGLSALAGRPARALSGGEKQRFAIIRALAAEPRLLLLDEPTVSLDPRATAAVEALIRRAAAGGAKVVLVTHDRGQVARLAEEVVFLHCGRVGEQSAAPTFLASPASAEARAYLAGDLLL